MCSAMGPGPHVAKRVAQLLKDCGLTHFTFQSDREPAIRALLLEVARLANIQADLADDPDDSDIDDADRPKPIPSNEQAHDAPAPAAVPETSSPREYQSNGAAERSIQMVEDHARTFK